MAVTDSKTVGHVIVLLTRLDALKAALDAQPDRTHEVEFQFDRVLRSATKLADLYSPPTTTEKEGR